MKVANSLSPIVFGAITAFFAAPAYAQCTCDKEDRDTSLNRADIVFWGKAKRTDDGDLVFRVSKSFKGTRRKRKLTVAPLDTCGYSFEPDTPYIVFAKKEKKRTISVSACSATKELERAPYTATTWSAADELPYGVGRRTVRRHQRDRDRLTGRAIDKVRYAAKKCDAVWKGGDDKANLLLKVRFDVQPNGRYDAEILEYSGGPESNQGTRECLADKLDGKKFRKFSGNAVSVRAYWKIDRIDASMQQEKKSSIVKPYEGDGSEREDPTEKDD
jgi:hypothetical protein